MFVVFSSSLSYVNEAKRCVQTEHKEEDKTSRESTLNPIMQFRKKERKKERKTDRQKKLFRVLKNKQFFRV